MIFMLLCMTLLLVAVIAALWYFYMIPSQNLECPYCVNRVTLKESLNSSLYCEHCQVDFTVDENGDLSPYIESPCQEELPFSVRPSGSLPLLGRASDARKATTNGLCRSCNHHQQIIVSLLSQSDHPDQNEQQLVDWRAYLERKYPLCSPCQLVVQKKLKRIGQALRLNYLDLLLAKEKQKHRADHQDPATWSSARLFLFLLCFLIYMVPYYERLEASFYWTCLLGLAVSVLDPISTLFTIILSASGLYLRHVYSPDIRLATTMALTTTFYIFVDVLFYMGVVNPYLALVLHSLVDGTKQQVQEPFFKLQRYMHDTQKPEKENISLLQACANAPAKKNHLLTPVELSPDTFKPPSLWQHEPLTRHVAASNIKPFGTLSQSSSPFSLSYIKSDMRSHAKLRPSILSPPSLGLEDSFASFSLSDKQELLTRSATIPDAPSFHFARLWPSFLLVAAIGAVASFALHYFLAMAVGYKAQSETGLYCHLF